MLKGDIGAWPSAMPSKIKSIETSVAHSISPSMMSYFNLSKVPYLIPSVAHLDMPSKLYSSWPKFILAAHSDIPSQLNSSLPKQYTSIQVKAPT